MTSTTLFKTSNSWMGDNPVLRRAAKNSEGLYRNAEFRDALGTIGFDLWVKRERAHWKLLRAIAAASKNGKPQKVAQLIKTALMSHKAKIHAITQCWIEGRWQLAKDQKLSASLLNMSASSLNLFKQIPGTARLIPQKKSNGGLRPTLAFRGDIVRAQFLVRECLAASGLGSAIEYAIKGLGRDKATDQIRAWVDDGFHHWFIFDIKDCFRSLKPTHVRTWLPLPEAAVQNVLFPNSYIHIHGYQEMEHIKVARRGLPQGAALSGQIASGFLDREVRPMVGSNQRVLSFVDDVAIGARDPADIEATAKAIIGKLQNLQAGPLTLKTSEIRNAQDGFEFLNYKFRIWNGDEDFCHICPNQRAFSGLDRGLRNRLNALGDCHMSEKEQVGRDYAQRWLAGHGKWNMCELAELNFESSVDQMIHDHGTIFDQKHKPILNEIIGEPPPGF